LQKPYKNGAYLSAFLKKSELGAFAVICRFIFLCEQIFQQKYQLL